jgi:polyisoprenoid-binding protein YceI
MLARTTLGLVLSLGAAACAKDSGSSHEQAGGSATPTPAAPTTAAKATDVGAAAADAPTAPAKALAKPGTYKLDPVHSFALFKVRHFDVGYVHGEFNDLSGTFKVDPDPTKSSVEISLKVDSIDTKDPKRDAHLKSPDFFNAAQFPAITFKSSRVAAPGADGWADVAGDLTIRGKSRPVTLQVRPVGAGVDPMKTYRAGFEARGTINRMDYDVAFMPGAIGDQVELTLSAEGTPSEG